MKAVEAPIPKELLKYCPLPNELPLTVTTDATEKLKEAMKVAAKNNQILASCYIMQKNLVDAVLRRLDSAE